MSWSLPLGSIGGTKVRLHLTFFLLLAWFGWMGWDESGWDGAWLYIGFVSLTFACVLAHEFGHIFAARHIGIRSPLVTLWPFGGLARLERLPEKPLHEIGVALAGPLVNVVIALALYGFLKIYDYFDMPYESWGVIGYLIDEVALALMYANCILAAFNLLPAFPMDGGRVLRALLAMRFGFEKATRFASIIGQIAAIGISLVGYFYFHSPIMAGVGLFVFLAARQEARMVSLREKAQQRQNPYTYTMRIDLNSPPRDDGA